MTTPSAHAKELHAIFFMRAATPPSQEGNRRLIPVSSNHENLLARSGDLNVAFPSVQGEQPRSESRLQAVPCDLSWDRLGHRIDCLQANGAKRDYLLSASRRSISSSAFVSC